MDPKSPLDEQQADAEPVPLENLLLPTAPAAAGAPVPLEELLLPDPPAPTALTPPARSARAAPAVSVGGGGPAAPAARRRILIASGIALAVLVVAAGAAAILRRSAPPATAIPTAPSPSAATVPSAVPVPSAAPVAVEPWIPSDKLFGGRTAEWWRQRLALLAGRTDPESRRLHEVTRARAVRLGIVSPAAAGPVPASPPTTEVR